VGQSNRPYGHPGSCRAGILEPLGNERSVVVAGGHPGGNKGCCNADPIAPAHACHKTAAIPVCCGRGQGIASTAARVESSSFLLGCPASCLDVWAELCLAVSQPAMQASESVFDPIHAILRYTAPLPSPQARDPHVAGSRRWRSNAFSVVRSPLQPRRLPWPDAHFAGLAVTDQSFPRSSGGIPG
jgi:hypothetical protein